MASADIPEELWASSFNPDLVRERMRWVMEYDLIDELAKKLQIAGDAAGDLDGPEHADGSSQVKMVC